MVPSFFYIIVVFYVDISFPSLFQCINWQWQKMWLWDNYYAIALSTFLFCPGQKKKNLGFIITHLLYTVTIFIILPLFEMMERNLPKIVFTVTPILQAAELWI